jgi:hypothetical protein
MGVQIMKLYTEEHFEQCPSSMKKRLRKLHKSMIQNYIFFGSVTEQKIPSTCHTTYFVCIFNCKNSYFSPINHLLNELIHACKASRTKKNILVGKQLLIISISAIVAGAAKSNKEPVRGRFHEKAEHKMFPARQQLLCDAQTCHLHESYAEKIVDIYQ